MLSIYFKVHPKREKEKIFFDFLRSEFPNAEHINDNYILNKGFLSNLIDIPTTIRLLECELKLSEAKRNQTIAALTGLPDKVYVARRINELSVDYTIVMNQNVRFIELHEKQHSTLSVSRLTPIFCSKNQRFEIPRFAQRLLKDIWRLQNLPNYKIVWWDWFYKNKGRISVSEILDSPRLEFTIDGRFSLSKLLTQL